MRICFPGSVKQDSSLCDNLKLEFPFGYYFQNNYLVNFKNTGTYQQCCSVDLYQNEIIKEITKDSTIPGFLLLNGKFILN